MEGGFMGRPAHDIGAVERGEKKLATTLKRNILPRSMKIA
jgi:hypothetical protein